MALIDCYECNRLISDLAAACPHCGAPSKSQPDPAKSATPTAPIAEGENPGVSAFVGALVGLFLGGTLVVLGCDMKLDDSTRLTFVLLAAAPFGIIGAIVGWALGRGSPTSPRPP